MSDASPDPANAAQDPKAAARAAAFVRRKTARRADIAAGGGAAAAAAALFLDAFETPAGQVVSGYRPIRTELDPTPLMAALLERGARLCVPVIEAAGRPLLFREWTPAARMISGPFGAEVPEHGDWLSPSLLIAPLAAFDRGGGRLGYGGGFYDRTLEQLSAIGPVQAVGYAYAAQQDDALPLEPTDWRLDAVVTEREVIRPRVG